MFLLRNTSRFEVDARVAPVEKRLAALEARLDAVESALDRRLAEVLSRFDDNPDDRLRLLLNSVSEELRQALSEGLDDARQVAAIKAEVAALLDQVRSAAAEARGAAGQRRFRSDLNVIHHAQATGYVSIFFNGGRTDRVKLMVGATDPPTEVVSELNCRNDINSYAGGVVRQGEFWTAKSEVGKNSGVECVFTPFL